MRKNLLMAIIAPCVLAVILIVMIIMDNRNSKKPNPPEKDGTEAVVVVSPTQTAETEPPAEPTTEPTTEPVPDPVQTPTDAPTPTPTQTPSPTPTTEPTTAPSLTPTPSPTPEAGNSTEVSQNPDDNGTEDPVRDDDQAAQPYNVLYSLEGDQYTLVADSDTNAYLLVNNQDKSVRKTGFQYAPEYEEDPGSTNGPILGYKNNTFFFMAGNQLVASNGESEKVLYTAGEPGMVIPNPIVFSSNRIMTGLAGTLVVADSRTWTVETYTHDYSQVFFQLTDEALCFSTYSRIPAGPYFHILYYAKQGNIKQLGMIGEIEEHVLDGNTVLIKSGADRLRIDMGTGTLTGSRELEKEYTLHLPVYSSGYLTGLRDITFINYNADGNPVQSIAMPGSWQLKCYYVTYYKIPYFYIISDKDKSGKLPSESGRFTVVDYSTFPLVDSKYLDKSTMKEQLYSGKTMLGEGEIFLLERYDSYYNKATEAIEEAPFEVIYAWIPIRGQTQAYQFYIYVPQGEDMTDYLKLMKLLLKAE